MKKTLSAAFIVATLALTSACGGDDDGGKPSKADLSAQIEESSDGAFSGDQADCAADVLLDSEISDEGLTALAEGDDDYEPSDEDQKVSEELVPDMTKCAAPE